MKISAALRTDIILLLYLPGNDRPMTFIAPPQQTFRYFWFSGRCTAPYRCSGLHLFKHIVQFHVSLLYRTGRIFAIRFAAYCFICSMQWKQGTCLIRLKTPHQIFRCSSPDPEEFHIDNPRLSRSPPMMISQVHCASVESLLLDPFPITISFASRNRTRAEPYSRDKPPNRSAHRFRPENRRP